MKNLQIDENKARKLYATASTEFKQVLEDTFGIDFFMSPLNLNEPVKVAGILWGGYLTPAKYKNTPVKFNEQNNLYYFDNETSAAIHAFEQGLKLPTKYQFQQLYNQTTQRNEIIGNIKYKVFTDKETGKELWMIYGGYYNFDENEFEHDGEYGFYWSSSLHGDYYSYALVFDTTNDAISSNWNYRACGLPIYYIGS